eukprot:6176620-Pleurochrysis_carterae.AAC.5
MAAAGKQGLWTRQREVTAGGRGEGAFKGTSAKEAGADSLKLASDGALASPSAGHRTDEDDGWLLLLGEREGVAHQFGAVSDEHLCDAKSGMRLRAISRLISSHGTQETAGNSDREASPASELRIAPDSCSPCRA